MKIKCKIFGFLFFLLTGSSFSWAQERAPFTLGGTVSVLTGVQYDGKNSGLASSRLGGLADVDNGFTLGQSENNLVFRSLVQDVRLSVAREWKKTYLKASVNLTDWGNSSSRGAGSVPFVDEAYLAYQASDVVSFEVGKFSQVWGVESFMLSQNTFASLAPSTRFVIPTQTTGGEVQLDFSHSGKLIFGIFNDLNSNGFGDSSLPSLSLTYRFSYGDENHVSFTTAAGPEIDSSLSPLPGSQNNFWDVLAIVSGSQKICDKVKLDYEGVYRHSDSALDNSLQKVAGGQLQLSFTPTDSVLLAYRFSGLDDLDRAGGPLGTGSGASSTTVNWNGGFKGLVVSNTFVSKFALAERATTKVEIRVDQALNQNGPNAFVYSLVNAWSYDF